jgi:hypothetical protein
VPVCWVVSCRVARWLHDAGERNPEFQARILLSNLPEVFNYHLNSNKLALVNRPPLMLYFCNIAFLPDDKAHIIRANAFHV